MIFVVAVIHDRADAERIAQDLLQSRLVAGYNLLGVESAFWWKGETLAHPETFILLRTTQELYDKLEARIAELSGYSVPEIFAVQPSRINAAYASWVSQETAGGQP
jgi:periplasmic divalent cation tolerance protein